VTSRRISPLIHAESTDTCVVYDPSTGQIRHVHRAITLAGGKHPTHAQLEARAMERARAHGVDVIGLKVLRVSGEYDPMRKYRVDVAKLSLVARRDDAR
jgi:hypothetical protein